MTSNPKIKNGSVNLVPEGIDPKDESIRISMIIEGDLLDALKREAGSLGLPYQTLMKLYLRQALELTPTNSAGLKRVLQSKPKTNGRRAVRNTTKKKSQ